MRVEPTEASRRKKASIDPWSYNYIKPNSPLKQCRAIGSESTYSVSTLQPQIY